MKHVVKYFHFIGMVGPSREQGFRLWDVTGREDRRMPMLNQAMGGERL